MAARTFRLAIAVQLIGFGLPDVYAAKNKKTDLVIQRDTACHNFFSQIDRLQKSKKPIHPLLRSVFRKSHDLLADAGLQDLSELRAILMKKPTGPGAKYLDIIDSGQYDIVVRRPEIARENVVRAGLTNAHETNLTMGAIVSDLPPNVRKAKGIVNLPQDPTTFWRSGVEATYLGLSKDSYDMIKAEDKPKYGYIRVSPTVANSSDSHGTGNYGSDSWVLKKDSIYYRTAFIMGDSQDRFQYGFPGSTKEWISNTNPVDWSSALLDLDHLPIIIPEVLPEFLNFNSYLFRVGPYSQSTNINESWKKLGYSRLSKVYNRSSIRNGIWANAAPYIETHIFGKIRIGDIEAFEFKKNPPSRSFCKQLRKKGIIIRDAREWPPKIFTEDEE